MRKKKAAAHSAGTAPPNVTLRNCSFQTMPNTNDADLMRAVVALAEAARENAVAINTVSKALSGSQPSGPMLQICGVAPAS